MKVYDVEIKNSTITNLLFYPQQIGQFLCDEQSIDAPQGLITRIIPVYDDAIGGVAAGSDAYVTPQNGEYASNTFTAVIDGSVGWTSPTLTLTAAQMATLFPRVDFTNAVRGGKLIPGTIKLIQGNGLVAVDTGVEGAAVSTFVGKGVDNSTAAYAAANIVNYQTGALTLRTVAGTAITADNPAYLTISVHADETADTGGLNAPKVPSISLKHEWTPVRAQYHAIKTQYSIESLLTAKSIKGENIDEKAVRAAAIALKNEKDLNIINAILRNATNDANLIFDATPKPGYSKKDFYGEIELMVDRAETSINQTVGRGGVDFVLVGAQGKQIFKQCASFEPAGNPFDPNVGSFLLGTLYGRINVVFARNMPDDTFVVGYRGFEFGDSAVVDATYVPLYLTSLLEDGNTMSNTRGLVSMYAVVPNVIAYLRKGTIINYT